MKQIISQRELDIPEGITVEVKGRNVRVKGPRGAFRDAHFYRHLLNECR